MVRPRSTCGLCRYHTSAPCKSPENEEYEYLYLEHWWRNRKQKVLASGFSMDKNVYYVYILCAPPPQRPSFTIWLLRITSSIKNKYGISTLNLETTAWHR